MDKLTQKHRLFVEAYRGDVVEAMLVAGYTGQRPYLEKRGNELLATPLVSAAIKERARYDLKTQNVIADRKERQSFWTSIMRNEDPHHLPEVDEHGVPKKRENLPLQQRLKASEYLAKSECDFVEQVNLTGNVTITDLVTQAYQIPDENLDAIEAEYEELRNKRLPPSPEEEPQSAPQGVDDFI